MPSHTKRVKVKSDSAAKLEDECREDARRKGSSNYAVQATSATSLEGPQSERTLWTTPADPLHRTLAALDTSGDAAKLARRIRDMPERDISKRVATFAMRPPSPETLKKSTGK